jgi:hypothetical protein
MVVQSVKNSVRLVLLLVEKCFTASSFSHKEAIVAELLAVQSELCSPPFS